MKIRYIYLYLLSMKINLRGKLRADVFVSLKSFVGNDERESDLYRRPGDRLVSVTMLYCEPVGCSGHTFCTCFGCLKV